MVGVTIVPAVSLPPRVPMLRVPIALLWAPIVTPPVATTEPAMATVSVPDPCDPIVIVPELLQSEAAAVTNTALLVEELLLPI